MDAVVNLEMVAFNRSMSNVMVGPVTVDHGGGGATAPPAAITEACNAPANTMSILA